MLGIYRNTLLRSVLKHSNQFLFSTSTEATKLVDTPQIELDKLFKIVELELRGNDPAVLNSFVKFAKTAGNHFNIQSES